MVSALWWTEEEMAQELGVFWCPGGLKRETPLGQRACPAWLHGYRCPAMSCRQLYLLSYHSAAHTDVCTQHDILIHEHHTVYIHIIEAHTCILHCTHYYTVHT
ncbi:unnamed protein product, partial [Discosporangium mesarthrocarpum]